MATLKIGKVQVTRVEESLGPGLQAELLLPDWRPEILEEHRSWMVPNCYCEAEGRFVASIHSWVIKTPHHTILVDSCVGNQKNRPYFDGFHMLDVPFLGRLADAGVQPEDVDFVLCTHLHVDHVGWNTRLSDGRWVPTFPNARYVFSKTDQIYWDGPGRAREDNAGVYDDSVLPVIEAGQDLMVEGAYELSDVLHLRPAPGHTPGHIVGHLRDGGEEGVFSGDVMHQPIQVYHPDWNSSFCELPDAACQTRHEILEYCAETRALLMPAHFGMPHTGYVQRRGDRFTWTFRDT